MSFDPDTNREVYGFCTECKTETVVICDADDASMLHQAHGLEHGHSFMGRMKVRVVPRPVRVAMLPSVLSSSKGNRRAS